MSWVTPLLRGTSHRIGSDRMRKIYFCRLEFDSAQGEARARPAVTRRSFLGAPLWSYRRAFTDFWKWVGLVLLRRPGPSISDSPYFGRPESFRVTGKRVADR